ncbi:MAG TPA: amidohydrolase family protein [Arthrobacter sp.]
MLSEGADAQRSPVARRLEGATVIDGSGATPQLGWTVIIGESGTISYAGPDASAPPRDDRPVEDLSGLTLLPGLIDAHVHLSFEPGQALMAGQRDPVLNTFGVAERMRRTLLSGITTVRDLGGVPKGFATAQETDVIAGPRMLTAGKILGHTGGHCDCTMQNGINAAAHFTALADDETALRVAVRTQFRDGADLVKICATGGMGSPHDDPDDEDLSEHEIRAVVDEARRHRGKKVAAHAQGTAGILNAIRGGVASIEHGYGITDEACDLALESGVFLVPTLSTLFHTSPTASQKQRDKKARWAERTRINIARAIERGVPVAMGTDAGVSPHGANAQELQWLVDLGMKPLDAITAATSNGARLLGVDGVTGTIRAGLQADMLVLSSDPAADVSVLGEPENIRVIIQSGIIRKDLRAARPGNAIGGAGSGGSSRS